MVLSILAQSQTKSLESFQASINAAARGLWRSELDALAGADALFSAIGRGFEQAWRDGAKEAGIRPDERTEEESNELSRLIGEQYEFVGRFVQWIVEHNKASGAPWEMIRARAQMWINRYEEVRNISKAKAMANRKLRWQIDGGEHCRTCLKLSGRVHRASVWLAHNISPRMITNRLRCGGYRCKCNFIETDQPATRGRFPGLP